MAKMSDRGRRQIAISLASSLTVNNGAAVQCVSLTFVQSNETQCILANGKPFVFFFFYHLQWILLLRPRHGDSSSELRRLLGCCRMAK